MPEYLVDVKLIATVRLTAKSEQALIGRLDDLFGYASVVFGVADKVEISALQVLGKDDNAGDEPDIEIVEIDGEAV